MKNYLLAAGIVVLCLFITSCDKDAGKLPNISFKTGSTFIFKDDTLAGDSVFVIGIDASKAESEDVLKKLNVSNSINGGALVSISDNNLSGSDQDQLSKNFQLKLDTIHHQNSKYVFTVTNRDGLTNQVSLVLTTK